MLFPYKYVPHKMSKMQEFIDFIFFEVWCQAPIGLVFHPDLFEGDLDLKEMMTDFGFSARAAQRGKTFYKDVKAIYELFAPLSPESIAQFQHWYKSNNQIEKACVNDPAVDLVRYADIAVAYPDLSAQLKSFFQELYSQSLLDLAILRSKIGDIDEHYKNFVSVNDEEVCPYCGINLILGENHTPRDAYDHYLPKVLYPFNSINFRNLAPACHHCNSTYKGTKDPAHNLTGRRKFFNPYSEAAHTVQIQIKLDYANIGKLKPSDFRLDFGPTEFAEEIETWKELYGIQERYEAKICQKNVAKCWLEEVYGVAWRKNEKPAEVLNDKVEQAKLYPYVDCNFLKGPFLSACSEIGLVSVFPQ
jgi:hypothetical protein